MSVKKNRLIFELPLSEKERKFKAVILEVMERAARLNQPRVYRNELCVKPNLFIHKYPDGKTELIEQDTFNSLETTIRIL